MNFNEENEWLTVFFLVYLKVLLWKLCSNVNCSRKHLLRRNKKDTRKMGEVDCITLHPGFQSVCLDVWVLQTAYFSLRQHYGKDAPQGTVQH